MECWTINHVKFLLPSVIVIILVSFLTGYILRHCCKQIRVIPIIIITTFLLAFEVVKQFYESTHFNSTGETNWDTFALPFHFSSIYLYIAPIYSFYSSTRTNKFSKAINSMFSSYILLMVVYMLILPSGVCSGKSIEKCFLFFTTKNSSYFGSFHSCFYHLLVILVGFLMLFLRLFESNLKQDLLVGCPATLLFCTFQACISNLIDTNFHNMLRCGVKFMDDARLAWIDKMGNFGQVLYDFIMVMGNSLAVGLSCLALVPITKGVNSLYKIMTGNEVKRFNVLEKKMQN